MIDYELQQLFNNDSVNKRFYITYPNGTITNTELHEEEFTLLEPLTTDDELTFGGCEASSVSFTVSNVFNGLDNAWLDISVVLDHNEDKPFKIGKYKVYSNVPTADRVRREILAYDAMFDIVNMDVAAWYNTILPSNDSNVTFKEFRDGFFEYVGVNQVETILPNDDMVVSKTIQADKISGKDVVTAICEINGCFGHINRDGDFAYVFLKDRTEALYPSDDLFPNETVFPSDENSVTFNTGDYYVCQYEDYEVKKIDALEIRQSDDSAGVVVGEGNNRYVMSGNILILGKTDEELSVIAQKIFNFIKHIEYRPFEATMRANLCRELGDMVRFNTKYEVVRSYILERRVKGIQNLIDTMSASGEEYRTAQVNNLYNDVIQLKGKTNTLERTAEETLSQISDLEKQTSTEIQQLADSVAVTIDKEGNVVTDLTLDKNGMTFRGNSIVIDTQNFKLDEEGNAEFLGEVIAKEGLSIYSTYLKDFFKLIEFTFESADDATIRFKDHYGDDFMTISFAAGNTFQGSITGNSQSTYNLYGNARCHDKTMRIPVGSSNTSKEHVNFIRSITNNSGVTRVGFSGGFSQNTDEVLYVTVETSDARLKENIKKTKVIALDRINQIEHDEFDWKSSNAHQEIGYVAQKLEKIDNRMVIPPENDDEYYQVNTFYMMGLVTKAIQELSAESKELSQENRELKSEIGELKKSVSFLMEKLGGMDNE